MPANICTGGHVALSGDRKASTQFRAAQLESAWASCSHRHRRHPYATPPHKHSASQLKGLSCNYGSSSNSCDTRKNQLCQKFPPGRTGSMSGCSRTNEERIEAGGEYDSCEEARLQLQLNSHSVGVAEPLRTNTQPGQLSRSDEQVVKSTTGKGKARRGYRPVAGVFHNLPQVCMHLKAGPEPGVVNRVKIRHV